ncbi:MULTISPECIES: LTA synthase family protein [Chryseobacterium]|uniref:Lipoteichoic acid synthase 1 n=1 Tax=Chryseobacterium taihuense TaxID=1141221 RepID=A0A4U8WAN2_9FLAO|nr:MULTISPECIES: alkaline phosphatase family protein [Chryseobacterium]QQV03310.1 sulfatase-like hydrolase/transferase [Chryseobacterium sp. FDAARGOS 1104]VFB03381.1 Lipoteichoic acid synthase 1 [Chryseobacterium taihuense]
MKFFKEFRKEEILILCYRIFLAFVFYQAARLLFWFFNKNLIKVESVSDYLSLAFHGVAFDLTAILYVNSLFIFLSLIPVIINTKKGYQKVLIWLYFITNGITYAMNFGDFVYYKFSQARLTSAAFQVAKNETNILKVFTVSVAEHPFVIIWFVILMFLWIFLYKKFKINEQRPVKLVPYFVWSVVTLCISAVLIVGGIRGDFKHSTRPINLVDANKFVKNPLQGNIVLNSTFSFFRTLGSNNFKEVYFVDQQFIDENINPYKIYNREVQDKPNIVIFIVESFGREYSGAFNRDKSIKDYVSYTPFIDSLANESLIFPNTFANGRQSIHGMSSILAGIPSLTDAFTSSPYSNQKTQSIVSVCNDLGYDTSFYHGAPNGSMGFMGFGNILGFKHYFGKDEYHGDQDFDGMWAIWDEPFLQYFAKNVGKKQPFMATVFTASSHHPFKIPEKYNGKFKKGNIQMHEPMQYTDYAIRQYFETAKKQPWFKNTIFVFTGDHTNQVFYPEYEKAMNRFAVPLMFYSPDPEYQLKGINNELAQQIDIYPTLADLIGYNKKIRSWGRSLVSENKYVPIIVNSDGSSEQFIYGNYIYRFDGKEITGIYDKSDLGFEKNLADQIKTPETEKGKQVAKAWYQDYMSRVINRKLN